MQQIFRYSEVRSSRSRSDRGTDREIEQVKLGCLAAEGLDYVALGKQTGKMAAKVLKGEKKASEMPFETITEAGLYLNTKVAENLGITVEDDLKNSAVETYDSISEN